MKKKIKTTNWPRWMQNQLLNRGITHQRVLNAIAETPRKLFVAPDDSALAEEDIPIKIGENQTISQPYVVALTLQETNPQSYEKILEIGAGSGWQAALLGKLSQKVHTLEIRPKLFSQAKINLLKLQCHNVHLHLADGKLGWKNAAKYDVIISAACVPKIPTAWTEQLCPNGRLLAPVGNTHSQQLWLLKKMPDGSIKHKILTEVKFVPLVSPTEL